MAGSGKILKSVIRWISALGGVGALCYWLGSSGTISSEAAFMLAIPLLTAAIMTAVVLDVKAGLHAGAGHAYQGRSHIDPYDAVAESRARMNARNVARLTQLAEEKIVYDRMDRSARH